MALEVVLFGYIEIRIDSAEKNREVLARFPFDETYPFRNDFSLHESKFYRSFISFSSGFHYWDPPWDARVQWIASFERLLGQLQARTARLIIEDETYPETEFAYFCFDPDGLDLRSGKKRWKRIQSVSELQSSQEEELWL